MLEISPNLASSLGSDVYALTKLSSLEKAFYFLNDKYNNIFSESFNEKNMLKGKSGIGVVKCRTAFGFTMTGQGPLEGNVFILFRGTQYLADWLTNINASISSSEGKERAHDGFNDAFKSMKPQINNFLNSIPSGKIKAIHCVGHSLGGAIATLCAEWIVTAKKGSVRNSVSFQ